MDGGGVCLRGGYNNNNNGGFSYCVCCQRDKIQIVNSLWQTNILSLFHWNSFTSTSNNNEEYGAGSVAEISDYFTWLEQLIITNCFHHCVIKSVVKVFRGRPCMLQWKWNCKHLNFQHQKWRRRRRQRRQHVTILFFPNRTIQFIGSCLTYNNVYNLYQHIQQLFSTFTPSFSIPFPCLKTMTIVYPLNDFKNFTSLRNIFNASNNQCVYETELFPGAQLSYWSPLHVVLFHTGSVTITGVQSFCQVDAVIHDLLTNRFFPLFDTK